MASKKLTPEQLAAAQANAESLIAGAGSNEGKKPKGSKKKENENKTFDDIDNDYKDNMHSTFGNNSEYGLLCQTTVRQI